MNKTITFTGHTAVPSDHDAPQGTLAQAFNLGADSGIGLQPLGEPTVYWDSYPGWTPRFIHSLPSGIKVMIYIGDDGSLGYTQRKSASPVAVDDIKFTGSDICFTATGNILLVHSPAAGMRYYLWRESSYLPLGNRPGFPVLEFGLQKKTDLSDESVEIKHAVETPWGDWGNGMSKNTMVLTANTNATTQSIQEYYQAITNGVYGKLYDSVNRAIEQHGLLFYQPFMLRYALRMFNGDYLWHSAPVLMLPNTTPPLIAVKEFYGPREKIYYSKSTYENIHLFALKYRIPQIGSITNWKDIISGIDIFVSAPFYTYEQSKNIEGHGDLAFCRGQRDVIGGIIKDRIGGIYSAGPGNPYKLHRADEDIPARDDSEDPGYWRIPDRSSKIDSDIRDCHDFYRIARLEIDDLVFSAELKDLPLEDGIDYQNLVTRPTLPDDFNSHSALYPKVSHVYNNRLNLADLEILPPAPMPVRACLPYTSEITDTDQKAIITGCRIAYKKNNRTYCREISGITSGGNDLHPWLIDTFSRSKPIFLFVPDKDAYQITYTYRQGADGAEQTATFNLRPHDFLNGAYYYAGLFVPAAVSGETDTAADSAPDSSASAVNQRYPLHNQLYCSEVNSPFVFPAVNATTVGNGTIMALASAARPLSQGQFGQYPLYAFTDEGIWALTLSDTGVFSARQPVTRHVLLSSKSICSLDSAVAFTSPQGLMILSGSEASCISDIIDSPVTFSMSRFHGLLSLLPKGATALLPLSTYIRNARVVYDGVNSRIMLFHPQWNYAYIYSMRSRLWTLTRCSLSHPLNSYPETCVVDRSGTVVQPFRDAPARDSVALVTRPLTLDIPDGLKTVRAVYVRGCFRRGHVQCALYGSRNLTDWYLVASSTDHRLRRISGTPYKYFTLAVLGTLDAGESVTSADFDFIPRYNNRLR